jgi:hypothetical protein
MKKFICVLFVVIALFSLTWKEKTFLQVIKSPIDAKYTLYTNQQIIPVASGYNNITSGSLNILSCNISQASELYDINQTNVLGQQIQFSCDSEGFYNYLKKIDCKIVFEENIGDIKSFYCFNKYLQDGINLPYGKVNLQVCYKDGYVTVGSPVIIGSY